jgi:hypothetical protein
MVSLCSGFWHQRFRFLTGQNKQLKIPVQKGGALLITFTFAVFNTVQ